MNRPAGAPGGHLGARALGAGGPGVFPLSIRDSTVTQFGAHPMVKCCSGCEVAETKAFMRVAGMATCGLAGLSAGERFLVIFSGATKLIHPSSYSQCVSNERFGPASMDQCFRVSAGSVNGFQTNEAFFTREGGHSVSKYMMISGGSSERDWRKQKRRPGILTLIRKNVCSVVLQQCVANSSRSSDRAVRQRRATLARPRSPAATDGLCRFQGSCFQ